MRTILPKHYDAGDTCVKAYDPDTKAIVGTYNNYRDASNKLGINASAIRNACGRRGRSFSRVFNKELALRLAAT